MQKITSAISIGRVLQYDSQGQCFNMQTELHLVTRIAWTNNRFTALWSRTTRVSWCSQKGETYWNNRWTFMSRMSFLVLNLVVWSSFVLQTWYQHPMS